MTELWRITVTVPEAAREAFEESLLAVADSAGSEIAEGGGWRIEALARERPDESLLAALLAEVAEAFGLAAPMAVVEPLAARDWLAENRAAFPPVAVGRFYVYGSHIVEPRPDGAIPLLMDAGPAFGAGTHGSTMGCLEALGRIAVAPASVLDLGCGSGILAVAAAKLWPKVRIMAVDNDPAAVANAEENAQRNGVADRVAVAEGDGTADKALRRAAPFDLVLANILLEPLVGMAADLAGLVALDGRAILSGVLIGQGARLDAAYLAAGLDLREAIEVGEWRTAILGHAAAD
ncbi:MAG: 50S ribosomal protein L11 methyltransferase [Proteobacteria bacterium]|nr:50S ribosomal protein L11 methyltransferase [Pseudomonadota bacterium]